MEMKNEHSQPETTVFYLIYGTKLGMENAHGAFLYEPRSGWIPDTKHVISDHLYGYDPGEPDDSPYKMFNTSIMDEIESISENEARKLVRPEHWDSAK